LQAFLTPGFGVIILGDFLRFVFSPENNADLTYPEETVIVAISIMLSALAEPAGTGLSSSGGLESQRVPNIRRSSAIVLSIYTAYTFFDMISLNVAGMSGFDAVNHAFTSISTGGFPMRPESIGYWKNPYIETVIIVLMVPGSINFFYLSAVQAKSAFSLSQQ
jgi:Trk-type K+ transport system membrane component